MKFERADKNEGKESYNCGRQSCVSLIIFILFFWAWAFGLTTSWGELNIDIFPPKVELIK